MNIMTLSNYFTFLIAGFLIAITPGPSTLFALSQGLDLESKASFNTILGLISGNAIYGLLALLGISSLLLSYPSILLFLKLVGSAYILCLSYHYFFKQYKNNNKNSLGKKKYLSGFIVAITNPSFLIFYVIFLPQFLDSNYSMFSQLVALSFSQLAIDSFVVCLYFKLANVIQILIVRKEFYKWINRVISILLFLIFLTLAFNFTTKTE